MAKRQNILSVDYITDDDTGMYRIGEIDFGVSGMLDVYLHENGRKGMDNILKTLCHLIWHVQQYGYPMIKKQEQQNGSVRNVSECSQEIKHE